jgi:hypothetical protein
VRVCLNVFLFTLPLWLVCLFRRTWIAVIVTVIVGALAKFVLEAVLSEPEPTCEFIDRKGPRPGPFVTGDQPWPDTFFLT